VFLLNLTWLQFAMLFGAVSAGVVALYLWDRSRRRIRVPTMRFWSAAQRATEVRHRKRIQQPLSLVLQLLAIALLLLSLAQLRLGSPGPATRDHVLILDTSASMAARSGGGLVMDEAREIARAYIRALRSSDRVMLVRADALATPATAFERNRLVLDDAVAQSRPGATALNLDQALEFARQAQKLQGGRAGEVVYIGPGRCSDHPDGMAARRIPNLRFLSVKDGVTNCGLKNIGVRRSASDPDLWEILVTVRNYGAQPHRVTLGLAFAGSPAGSQQLTLQPGMEQNATFRYRARGAGWLEARLQPEDDFPGNDRASVELPARRPLKVHVYSEEPGLLRPLLASHQEVDAVFRRPAQYAGAAGADIVIFDRFSPPAPPAAHVIWIEPPGERAPAVVRTTVRDVPLTRWRTEHPLASGLRTADLRLESGQVLAPAPGDAVVADVEQGPVMLARSAEKKTVVLGFHPVRTAMRYELATPLLFANMLRWMAPDTFRRAELNAGSVGTVNIALGPDADADGVRVVSAAGHPVPHTLHGRTVRFFVASPGTVRVATGDREMVYSLTLPEVAESRWTPAQARRGLPRPARDGLAYVELWPWLAAAGGALLLAEWLLFGRWRQVRVMLPAAPRVRRKRGRLRSMIATVRSLL
jgi:hypothetical protein